MEHKRENKRRYGSKVALYGLAITGGLAIGVTIVTASFLRPALRRICLPFVPATDRQISNVLKLCRPDCRSSFVDLGSGDGRIVLAAARRGYQATGVELNTWLILYSKIVCKLSGLSSKAHFRQQDLWKAQLSGFDNIVIFGVSEMMEELSVKLENEAGPHASVVACRFPIARWTPVRMIEDGVDSAWLYTRESFKR